MDGAAVYRELPDGAGKTRGRVTGHRVTGAEFNLFHAIVGSEAVTTTDHAQRVGEEIIAAAIKEQAQKGPMISWRATPTQVAVAKTRASFRQAVLRGKQIRAALPTHTHHAAQVCRHAIAQLDHTRLRLTRLLHPRRALATNATTAIVKSNAQAVKLGPISLGPTQRGGSSHGSTYK